MAGWKPSDEPIPSEGQLTIASKRRINYDRRVFRLRDNSINGEAGSETLFCYHEKDGVVWAEYYGGEVVKGMLLARKAGDGSLDVRYSHVNLQGELRTGICNSVVEVMADGRYRLFEKWRWTSGCCTEGQSVIEETSAQSRVNEQAWTPSKGFSIAGLC